ARPWVAGRAVLARRDRLTEIPLELEEPICRAGPERIEEPAHAASARVAPGEEGDERLEPVLAGGISDARPRPRASANAPQSAEEADPRLLLALQALLGHRLGPQRLVPDHQPRAGALRLVHFRGALQRDVERIVVREVERPRRAHVVGNLVGGEIRETGVQLPQRGPE